jgi:hypothetical protein
MPSTKEYRKSDAAYGREGQSQGELAGHGQFAGQKGGYCAHTEKSDCYEICGIHKAGFSVIGPFNSLDQLLAQILINPNPRKLKRNQSSEIATLLWASCRMQNEGLAPFSELVNDLKPVSKFSFGVEQATGLFRRATSPPSFFGGKSPPGTGW